MQWMEHLDTDLLQRAADSCDLDLVLLAAIVQTESAGVPARVRYEGHYRWLVDPPHHAERLGITADTETVLQRCSWGLMQVMGATAREMGFDRHLPELCDPALGLLYGGLYFKRQFARYKNIQDAIAAYNAGSVRLIGDKYENQLYVDKVLYWMRRN